MTREQDDASHSATPAASAADAFAKIGKSQVIKGQVAVKPQ
jgi:hypothetical protein